MPSSSETSKTTILGIQFAPLFLPLKRRIQTTCVFLWTMLFLIGGFGMLILSLYILICTQYYWMTLLCYAWIWYDRNTPSIGGRRFNFIRNASILKYLVDYFPITLHKTVDLDLSKNYLCGFHPHGIFAVGAFSNFATEATGFGKIFPGLKVTLLTLRGQFFFPLYRDLVLSSGSCDVSNASVDHLLKNSGTGNFVVIVIGGAVEVLEAKPGTYTVILKKRKGFVKKALVTGSQLIPIYSFGETEIYKQVSNPPGSVLKCIQTYMKSMMGFPPSLFYGRGVFNYTFGLIPFRKPINTVVGEPIEVTKIENPTQEDIDSLHEKYCQRLSQIFDDNKVKYGIKEEISLQIV